MLALAVDDGILLQQIFDITTFSLILDLPGNLFKGTLALEVGNLNNLVELYIFRYQFSDEILKTLSTCTKFIIFLISMIILSEEPFHFF